MKKASALTAALSGAPAPGGADAKVSVKPAGNKLDNAAFPCLAYAREGAAQEAVTEAMGGLDLSSVVIVGSAPTRIEANGMNLVRPASQHHACSLLRFDTVVI